MDSVSTAVATFRSALKSLFAHDIEAYASHFAPDAVIEWPFAPAEFPKRLEGRAEIIAHVGANLARSRAAGRSLREVHDLVLHEKSPRDLVAEFNVEIASSSGETQLLPYVHVYELDEHGKIRHLRDYFGSATSSLARPNHAQIAFERIEASILAWDADAFADCFAEDGRIEWPFAPPGLPKEVSGREAIRAQSKAMMSRADEAGRRIVRYHDVIAHPTTTPDIAVIEFSTERRQNETSSSLPYVWVIETRAGRIHRVRDYYDSAAATRLA